MKTVVKKICLVGVYGVGKTSLIARFVRQTFSEKYLTTLGVKIDTKVVTLDSGDACKLVIWDIAGKDEYSSTDKQYLKGSSGCLLVIDGTRKNSALLVLKLKEQISETLGEIPCVCALNKSDLQDQWQLTDEDEQVLAGGVGGLFKTSALSGDNVEAAFSRLAELMSDDG
jgi:small GTP-binding protein